MKRGWYHESYRHSLASKGIRTSFVRNSAKGNRTRPEDLVWSDKHGRFVDWRKVASAQGIPTGNKREALKKGDTMEVPYGINIYEGQVEAERQPAFTEFSALPTQVTLPVTPPMVQEYEAIPGMNLAPIPDVIYPAQIGSLSEQQAQPVEDETSFIGGPSPLFKKETAEFLPPMTDVDVAIESSPKVAMASKRPEFKYAVEYWTKPYGENSSMVKKEVELAVDRDDAEQWKDVLEKDNGIWGVEIKRLESGF